MEDGQASFQVLRLSTAVKTALTLTKIRPDITKEAAEEIDQHYDSALADIIVGPGAGEAGLPSLEKVRNDPAAHLRQTLLGEDAMTQAWRSIREGGYGLTGSENIRHAVYIGSNALVLARAMTIPTGPDPPIYLERLPDKPVVAALIESLMEIASVAKPHQQTGTVGPS